MLQLLGSDTDRTVTGIYSDLGQFFLQLQSECDHTFSNPFDPVTELLVTAQTSPYCSISARLRCFMYCCQLTPTCQLCFTRVKLAHLCFLSLVESCFTAI